MSNIIDLNAARKKKQIERELTEGRTPLAVSHGDGTIGDGISRVKTSLEKIERILKELKELAAANRDGSDVAPQEDRK